MKSTARRKIGKHEEKVVFYPFISYNRYNKFTLGGITMVQLIVGKKGKGKTKQLLDKVNSAVKEVSGNIVYLDKSSKNMYELNNKIRLINVSDYMISDCDEFIGFICGIISQDHDLEQMYLDSFLVNSHLEGKDITPAIEKLQKISDTFKVEFVLSISLDEAEIPENLKKNIIVSL